MEQVIPASKHIALVAHDGCKALLLAWAAKHKAELMRHQLYATGTTGKLLARDLNLTVHCFNSGPLGGDQQIGAHIVEAKIHALIFFWDPLEPLPHDPDVKALLRLATIWNIPVACNQTTADFLISSPLFQQDYQRLLPDTNATLTRLD